MRCCSWNRSASRKSAAVPNAMTMCRIRGAVTVLAVVAVLWVTTSVRSRNESGTIKSLRIASAGTRNTAVANGVARIRTVTVMAVTVDPGSASKRADRRPPRRSPRMTACPRSKRAVLCPRRPFRRPSRRTVTPARVGEVVVLVAAAVTGVVAAKDGGSHRAAIIPREAANVRGVGLALCPGPALGLATDQCDPVRGRAAARAADDPRARPGRCPGQGVDRAAALAVDRDDRVRAAAVAAAAGREVVRGPVDAVVRDRREAGRAVAVMLVARIDPESRCNRVTLSPFNDFNNKQFYLQYIHSLFSEFGESIWEVERQLDQSERLTGCVWYYA